jgi:hypothetical protein
VGEVLGARGVLSQSPPLALKLGGAGGAGAAGAAGAAGGAGEAVATRGAAGVVVVEEMFFRPVFHVLQQAAVAAQKGGLVMPLRCISSDTAVVSPLVSSEGVQVHVQSTAEGGVGGGSVCGYAWADRAAAGKGVHVCLANTSAEACKVSVRLPGGGLGAHTAVSISVLDGDSFERSVGSMRVHWHSLQCSYFLLVLPPCLLSLATMQGCTGSKFCTGSGASRRHNWGSQCH